MEQDDERRQLEHARTDLLGEFAGALPATTVNAAFNAALSRFADAQVRTYLPVLVSRVSRTDLRSRLLLRWPPSRHS